jgi:hypothetical protein
MFSRKATAHITVKGSFDIASETVASKVAGGDHCSRMPALDARFFSFFREHNGGRSRTERAREAGKPFQWDGSSNITFPSSRCLARVVLTRVPVQSNVEKVLSYRAAIT